MKKYLIIGHDGTKLGEILSNSSKVAIRKWNTLHPIHGKRAIHLKTDSCSSHYACDCFLDELSMKSKRIKQLTEEVERLKKQLSE